MKKHEGRILSSNPIELSSDDNFEIISVQIPDDMHGPGILAFYPSNYNLEVIHENTALYAAEGYNCVSVVSDAPKTEAVHTLINEIEKMESLVGGIAAIGFGDASSVAILSADNSSIKCLVCYGAPKINDVNFKCSTVIHCGGNEKLTIKDDDKNLQLFSYPDSPSNFFTPLSADFDKPATMIAYSRTLNAIRNTIGPIYNLTALWELHTHYEFGERDVDATMSTMVEKPYVNHIPTMTGGVGYKDLKKFYTNFFVNSNPPDTKLVPISRTIGSDRLVDEMIFTYTHTCEIPWMLPNVKPTGKFVQVPLVAIVNFRGNKLYHEHIYWDQASVLAQIGLIDPAGLPIVGYQAAEKLMDETLPSNELMGDVWINTPE